VFVPPESAYDLARARAHIWGGSKPVAMAAKARSVAAALPDPAPGGFRFPALAWLDALLAPDHGWSRAVILMPPTHQAGVPGPGSPGLAREQACKAAIRDIARRRGVPFIDFRIPSPITSEDANYWDALHYRVPIAARIVEGLAKALATGRDEPGGDWIVRHLPPRGP
jgi:hypothetical protein